MNADRLAQGVPSTTQRDRRSAGTPRICVIWLSNLRLQKLAASSKSTLFPLNVVSRVSKSSARFSGARTLHFTSLPPVLQSARAAVQT